MAHISVVAESDSADYLSLAFQLGAEEIFAALNSLSNVFASQRRNAVVFQHVRVGVQLV